MVESAPNPDQLKTILSYLPSPAVNPAMVLLSAHPSTSGSSEQPTTPAAISAIADRNPKALKWPIVVDWFGGRTSIGDVEGVKGILEHLRKEGDGD